MNNFFQASFGSWEFRRRRKEIVTAMILNGDIFGKTVWWTQRNKLHIFKLIVISKGFIEFHIRISNKEIVVMSSSNDWWDFDVLKGSIDRLQLAFS